VSAVPGDVAYAAGMTATNPASRSDAASPESESPADPASRVVRKDVARNRALLIAAADEVFTERGADATLDDIARHAGVGVATAYRHFENKHALLAAMFEDRLNKILEMMLDADALPDPRESFEAFVYGIAAMQAHDRGMREVMRTDHGIDKVSAIRQRVQPIALRIVSRAQAAGILRPELEPNDIPMVLWMTGAISDYTGPVSSELWRRYLDFMLDGMLAESLPRRTISVPALDEAQLASAMHNWHSHR
jgi:AcrR family transcriptional regulator